MDLIQPEGDRVPVVGLHLLKLSASKKVTSSGKSSGIIPPRSGRPQLTDLVSAGGCHVPVNSACVHGLSH